MTMKEQIISALQQALKPLELHTAILFGSYAYGNPKDDSDIDILAVLNNKEKPRNYRERRENRLVVRRALAALNREYPLDILVYTIPEWLEVSNVQSSFIDEIVEKGTRL